MEKILVIKKRAIGDTVISLPTVEVLKELFPLSKIYYLTKPINKPILDNHPAIFKTLTEPDEVKFTAIRKEKFDIIINLHASQSTAFLSILSGTKTRIINNHSRKTKHPWSSLDVPDQGTCKSAIERDMDAIRALGFNVDPNTIKPKIYLRASEIEWAKKFIHNTCLLDDNCNESCKNLISISPNASKNTKKWPHERFQEITKTLSKQSKILWFLEPDQSIPEKCCDNMIYIKETDLRKVAALLAISKIFIGNDSGLKHIAAAVGTKTLTFFGPENPIEWHPYDLEKHQIFFKDVSCRTLNGHWCALEKCDHHTCMKLITVNDVLEKIKTILP